MTAQSMKAQWQTWSEKFSAISRREQLIVAAASVFGIAFLGFNFGVDPLLLKARLASKTIARVQAEITPMQAQTAVISSQNIDPDAANRARLEQVRKDLAKVSDRLATFESGMVPPQRMQSFLESLLAKNQRLELLALKTLPAVPVGTATERKVDTTLAQAAEVAKNPATALAAPAVSVAPAAGIYQHGIELKIAGSYNDLLSYLAELERMPQRVMWNSVKFEVKQHPRNEMTLVVYTLSLDQNWLVV
jgi:MSHA biogenesis protein MshJ